MAVRKRNADQAPRLDPVRLDELRDGDAASISPGGVFEGERFAGGDLSGRAVTGLTLMECELLDLRAHEADLQGSRFVETRFERLDAPSLKTRRTTWKDVEILSSRIGAAEMYDAGLHQVLFEGSKLGWVNLRASELRDVLFRGCHIDELDLGGSRITRMAFDGCTVGKLVLTGVRAEGLDLRGLEFSAIEGLDGMRGAIVSEAQSIDLAPIFAAHFGMEVRAG